MKPRVPAAVIIIAVALAATVRTSAQSSDALLRKLVEKGILTADEAKQLKSESAKEFTSAMSVKTGMPEWVTALKFSGDFRGRFNMDSAANEAAMARNRWRYRARFGFVATLKDDFEVGLRLASGDVDSGSTVGSSPLSSYQTFQNNASKKGVLLDQAYARWTPLHTEDWKGGVAFGKQPDPFVFSEVGLGMDPDYTPEGVALPLDYRLNADHSLRWVNGFFVLDELAASSNDPFLLGSQVRLESKWSRRVSTSVGVMFFSFANVDKLSNGAMPNANVGNWRIIPTGTNETDAVPQFKFNPILADASVTYLFDHAPLQSGPFPVRLVGSYMNNPAAPSSADNYAWTGGIMLGKAGKRGTWELAYEYKWLGANAIWEEVADDDFGGYWSTTAGRDFGNKGAAGFFTGTNVRGHILRLSYSTTDALMLSVRWYHTELIREPLPPPGADANSQMTRVMLDADLKF